jgi:hypothetical protein
MLKTVLRAAQKDLRGKARAGAKRMAQSVIAIASAWRLALCALPMRALTRNRPSAPFDKAQSPP